jgi:N-acetylglucosamine-6-phosphate deacetylase
MTNLALTHATLYTPEDEIQDGVLLVEGGKILACGPRAQVPVPADAERLDLREKRVFPGLIDVHIHGLLGHSAMGEGLAQVIQTLPRFGVTGFLATTVTLSMEEITRGLSLMREVLAAPPFGSTCLGIHLEGPHLSPKRPGMANPAWFHPLSAEAFDRLQELAGGHIRMITFAPEEGQALHVIPHLRSRAVVPVIGHSDATYEQVAQAVRLGLNHATHTYNAMRPMHHRDPGVVGAVLAFPEITAELIADGHHVHPGAMRVLLNAKGVEGVCLISDAAPFAALPAGVAHWGEYEIVLDGETCRLPDGTLAGAYWMMDRGFRILIEELGLTPGQAAICASRVPARTLGLEGRKGRLAPGYDADISVMDAAFRPWMTLVGGRIAWKAERADEAG